MDTFTLFSVIICGVLFLVLIIAAGILKYFFDEIFDYLGNKAIDGIAKNTAKELCDSIGGGKITKNKPVSYKCSKCNSFFCEHVIND